MTTIVQSSALPPAQPVYVLRGHAAQVHALCFLHDNLRLLSGDADGWVVLWDMPIRRAVAVWKAHAGPILGLASWGRDNIVTHGRDNKICAWQLGVGDEATLSKTLPIDDANSERKQPWLLHSLTVNALNFCSFAMCQQIGTENPPSESPSQGSSPILLATPGAEDGYVNVTSLPSEERVATIPIPPGTKTGMTMAIDLCFIEKDLTVIAGYESGHAALWTQNPSSGKWQVKRMYQDHAQPILSLAITPDRRSFLTSSADAIIARHRTRDDTGPEPKAIQTRHAGQQSLKVRSDGKVFATAGWDGRVRVYSAKSMDELAVLKWHTEGCYATAFAEILDSFHVPPGLEPVENSIVKRDLTVSQKRTERAKTLHLLAAGSKDGKISLWDIY